MSARATCFRLFCGFKLIIVLHCREKNGVHLLTVKCFRPYERNVKSGLKAYDSNVSRIWTNLTKKLNGYLYQHLPNLPK